MRRLVEVVEVGGGYGGSPDHLHRPPPSSTNLHRPIIRHATGFFHLHRHRRRADRQSLRAHHRPRPHARMAAGLPVGEARPQAHRPRRPPPHLFRARRPPHRRGNRSHRLQPALHLRLGRDPPPRRLPHLLRPPVPRRRHQNHHEAHLGAQGPARLAARPVLSTAQFVPAVRWAAAKPKKSTDEVRRMRNVKCGMRNGSERSNRVTEPTVTFRIPHSAFRIYSAYGTSTVIPSFATVV